MHYHHYTFFFSSRQTCPEAENFNESEHCVDWQLMEKASRITVIAMDMGHEKGESIYRIYCPLMGIAQKKCRKSWAIGFTAQGQFLLEWTFLPETGL